jgi:hypothetical protein
MSQQFNVSPDNLRMAVDYIADFEIVVNRCACEKGPLVTATVVEIQTNAIAARSNRLCLPPSPEEEQ